MVKRPSFNEQQIRKQLDELATVRSLAYVATQASCRLIEIPANETGRQAINFYVVGGDQEHRSLIDLALVGDAKAQMSDELKEQPPETAWVEAVRPNLHKAYFELNHTRKLPSLFDNSRGEGNRYSLELARIYQEMIESREFSGHILFGENMPSYAELILRGQVTVGYQKVHFAQDTTEFRHPLERSSHSTLSPTS